VAAAPPAAAAAPAGAPAAPARLSISMRGSPEVLVGQNNHPYDDLVAACRRQTPKWDLVDCQYWALSKKQYHGPYDDAAWQAMSGTMRTGDALAKIGAPALILKADAGPEIRKAHEAAASVMPKGRLVHIDGAGHNLHHDHLARTVDVLTAFLSEIQG
jgi:pimeloyl-ACP methyl ester carboxylesterase